MKKAQKDIPAELTNDFIVRKTADDVYTLDGDLTLDQTTLAEKELNILVKKAPSSLRLNGASLKKFDTAGALLLTQVKSVMPQIRFEDFSQDHTSLLALVEKVNPASPLAPKPHNYFLFHLEELGRKTIDIFESVTGFTGFFGQVVVFLARSIIHPHRFRLGSLARHIKETGIDAIPIVALVAFLISVVLAYQGAFQLRPLGAASYTVNLVAVSVLREMGVLLTSIMVAGRSGSAFTAEIGVMKVNEEVDALTMIGIEPFDILVIPRLLALLLTLPLLTFISDIVGLLGGYVTCSMILDTSWQQYWDQVRQSIHLSSFTVGIIKAPVFAIIIGIVGCRLGMQVSGSAESVGTFTTRSVVESIFIVLVADALFSVLFSQIGW
jgi:phospholipid/cholesterol/gamma-HCH transport system permease protein